MSQSAALSATAAEDVERRVKAARTSFSAGMMLLPKARRDAMHALYAFCREVDDIADDDCRPEAWRMRTLGEWRRRIGNLMRGEADSHPIAQALLPVIKTYQLQEADLLAIIVGMERDVMKPMYAPGWDELDTYCDCVASAVGRNSVRIFGDSSAGAQQVAHHLGRALQLTNILRDIAEDAERGRLYLPKEALEHHGALGDTLDDLLNDPRTRAVCAEVAEKAEQHFVSAAAYMKQCNDNAMRPARIMGAYYHAILKKLVAKEWRGLRTRVTLSPWHKLWLVISNL